MSPQLADVRAASIRAEHGRPLVIGHRGAPRVHAENSLDGFRAALGAGADGVEFDVRVAGDGTPVVCHDADLWRTHQERVTLAALPARALPVPRLETVLHHLAEEHPRALLDIELKEPVSPERLGAILDAAGWRGPLAVTSFLPDVARAHAVYGAWASGLLIDDRHLGVGAAARLARDTEVQFLAVRNPVFLRSLRETLREQGAGLWVWTLNRRAHIHKAARLGADAIVTDLPGLAATLVDRQ